MKAFEEATKLILSEAFRKVSCELAGIPFVRRLPLFKTRYMMYEVIADFTYVHHDQDIHHGTYHFTAGEYIRLSDTDPMWFMPSRSNLKFLGYIKIIS